MVIGCADLGNHPPLPDFLIQLRSMGASQSTHGHVLSRYSIHLPRVGLLFQSGNRLQASMLLSSFNTPNVRASKIFAGMAPSP